MAFAPKFEAQAGIRYYHFSLNQPSTQIGAFTVNGAVGNDIPYKQTISTSESGSDPSFTLTYNIDLEHMVYARAAEGFRLAVRVVQSGQLPLPPQEYGPRVRRPGGQ